MPFGGCFRVLQYQREAGHISKPLDTTQRIRHHITTDISPDRCRYSLQDAGDIPFSVTSIRHTDLDLPYVLVDTRSLPLPPQVGGVASKCIPPVLRR
jgi:hypothetical protein